MKPFYIALWLAIVVIKTNAQPNLVPNPSFENYSICPIGGNQINYANGWFQPNTFGSSTDYFNSCSSNNQISVPNNILGNQSAKGGLAYAGIMIYWANAVNYREYLEVELSDSLLLGEGYCISFYVSLADKMMYSADKIGSYFSNSPLYYNSSSYQPILLQPQVENSSGILSDTSNWTLISGVYVANGGEKYMTIGNFFDDNNTSSLLVHPNQSISYAYYYIDEVSVVHGLCNTGINENSKGGEELVLFPNPAKEKVTINKRNDEKISIWSIDGRLLLADCTNSSVDVSEWEEGIYIVSVIAKDGKYRVAKLIVAK